MIFKIQYQGKVVYIRNMLEIEDALEYIEQNVNALEGEKVVLEEAL